MRFLQLITLSLIGLVGCESKVDVEVQVAELEKLGASIQRDQEGKVNSVVLSSTKITDDGLEHLKGLANLKILILYSTQITDAGLEHLKGLTDLGRLSLDSTQITDAGLENLKGLTNLEGLVINRTQVTDEGVADLKKSLPNCTISK